eukprot:754888-Alexandrium_andersonii.AAC.1
MMRVIRGALSIGPLGWEAANPTNARLMAAAQWIVLPVEDGNAQAAQLQELADMVKAIEEERRDLKIRDAASAGEFDAAVAEYIEDPAKVAHFRMKAMIRLEPTRVAD